MSTRCQVRVKNEEGDKLTLYHHTDGYPSYMIPKIQEAWKKYGQGWEGARVYKVASMLCAVDPAVFEPLSYHTLHADIEYFYEIDCTGESHTGTKPVWTITAYTADFAFDKDSKKTEEERLHKFAEIKSDEELTEEKAEELDNQN